MNKYLLSCIFAFLTVIDPVTGQNLGYAGKKNCLGIGISLNNGLSLNAGAVTPSAMLERSISVQSSIKAGFSISSDRLDFTNQDVYINGLRNVFVPENNWDVDMQFRNPLTGTFSARIEKFNLAYRNYALKRGAIAPLGIFYEFGFNASVVHITEFDGQVIGEYRREPIVMQFKNLERMQSNFDLGFRFAIGEKRFLDNRKFLEYSVAVSLDGLVDDRSYFYSHMQAAHYTIRKEHILRSFFHVNFIYGVAY